jgi:hypothetical protein
MDTYGAATDPRPATPNEEVVVFVDTTTPGLITEPDGTLRVPEDMAVPGKTLLMRYYESAPDHGISIRIGDVENNWRVAALYEETA